MISVKQQEQLEMLLEQQSVIEDEERYLLSLYLPTKDFQLPELRT